MKLYNTLTRKHDTVRPLDGRMVRIYSCGPTVYDHAHIGNLSAYIFADTLRRAVRLQYPAKHVMNYTDVDDKTIRRSAEKYPDNDPMERLRLLTDECIVIFRNDMSRIGNDLDALTFVRATDEATIRGMQELVASLHKAGFAYIADDGVYFSIEAYRKSGKTYGQLLEITAQNTGSARIQNDEYDKESVHDFALWKKQKDGEPAWEFTLGGQDLAGRPGWHIECSVMSRQQLGQPFDIHTGGIDLIFPHHENEIAQSTALESNPVMAAIFAHNDHILVGGKKMAKSAQNFYTLQDVVDRGFDPLAFRMLVLQAHYRSQVNFTWESLEAAQNRLQGYRAMAALQHQPKDVPDYASDTFGRQAAEMAGHLQDDLNTPLALTGLSAFSDTMQSRLISKADIANLQKLLREVDAMLGLSLSNVPDIGDEQRQLVTEREAARTNKDWALSDKLRGLLAEQGVGLRDTPHGTVWYYL